MPTAGGGVERQEQQRRLESLADVDSPVRFNRGDAFTAMAKAAAGSIADNARPAIQRLVRCPSDRPSCAVPCAGQLDRQVINRTLDGACQESKLGYSV